MGRHLLTSALPWLLALALPFMVGFGPPKLVESDRQQMPVSGGQFPGIAAATPPPLKGMAALIMDGASGRVVYERNGYHHIAPASITKLMTALVAVERAKLTDRITIKPSHMVEGSSMGLRPGEEPTVEDLLWGMLLPSGNDAAQALADGLGGGTPERFFGWMNEKARSLGMRDSQFRNPHGLDEDGHYSTAFDMAIMAREALKHPVLARMAATQSHNLTVGQRVFYLVNTNRLLGRTDLPGVDGVKTGFTDHAGDSLVASATRNGRRVIVLALGTNMERAQVAGALLDYAFAAYTWVPVGKPPFATWQGTSGQARHVVAAAQRAEMVPRWQLPYLGVVVDLSGATSDASAQPGGAVGRLVYRTGERHLVELPAFLQDTREGNSARRIP